MLVGILLMLVGILLLQLHCKTAYGKMIWGVERVTLTWYLDKRT